jgi:uncharacterized membrane protein
MATFQVISIVLAALVLGVFWGPWVGLTRSIAAFEPGVFLGIVRQLSQNLAPVMTILMPAALLSMLPVLIFAFNHRPATFYLTLAALACFAAALAVTMTTEVPIVKQIESWTTETIPDNWQYFRDRWLSFHLLRVSSAIVGLTLLAIGTASH